MAQYIKTLSTPCPSDLLEAVNADAGITPTCLQAIDTSDGNITFDFDGDLNAEEAALDALISGWSCPVANNIDSADGISLTLSYVAEESKIIDVPTGMTDFVIHVMDPNAQELINSTLLSPAGIGWDPGNKSTMEGNINNGVQTDLCYNNSASGNTAGVIFGIDMGVATTVTAMKRYDYTASYYDTSWSFIGTNDATGATYNTIFSVKQSAANLTPNPHFQTFAAQNYRYYGVRCGSSFNATYTIISELELYNGTLATVEKKLKSGEDYEYKVINPTQIEVANLHSKAKTLKIMILGV